MLFSAYTDAERLVRLVRLLDYFQIATGDYRPGSANMDTSSEHSKGSALGETPSDSQILQRLEAIFDEVNCSISIGRLPSIRIKRHRSRNDHNHNATFRSSQELSTTYRKIEYGSKAFRRSPLEHRDAAADGQLSYLLLLLTPTKQFLRRK